MTSIKRRGRADRASAGRVTPLFRNLVAQYRSIERTARRAVRSHLAWLRAARVGHP